MIGVSIQSPALKENRPDLMATYGSLVEYLTALKSKGVKSIEIRKLSRGLDDETYTAINKSVQMIWDMGMEITIHGDVEGDFEGEKFVDLYPSMKYILENFRKYQSKIVMPIHAVQEKSSESNASSDELKEKTILLFKKWTKIVEQENLPIYFALENNRAKDKTIDPGNSCKVVVEMVEAIDHSQMGICWDMGHLYSNLLAESEKQLELNDLPPKEFIEKVIHTHIHALNSTGRTHFTLTEGYDIPLESYVNALKEADYDGVYNLELSYDRFDENSPIAELVMESVDTLGKV